MPETTGPERSAAHDSAAPSGRRPNDLGRPEVVAVGGGAGGIALARVDQTVTRICALVSEGLAGATAALLDQNHELGRRVIGGDQVIDELTAWVEHSIWEVIRRDALDATGLRSAVVILLVLPEL